MKAISVEDAVALIPDGATLMIGGFMGVGTPERVIDEIVRQGKRNLVVVANDTALLYTSRGHFIEYDVFVDQMPRVLRCRHITQDQLRTGRWSDAIDALLQQPAPPERPRTDGAEVAARTIMNLVIG